jgi:hypothetical protein
MSEVPEYLGRLRGASLIMAERARQILVEGFTVEHDVEAYKHGELLRAAYGYLLSGGSKDYISPWERAPGEPPPSWPWAFDWWKPSDDPVRDLEKAGALIAAEIDRLLALKDEPT